MKTEKQISLAAAKFAERWKGRGYERGESQPFWIDLLSNVLAKIEQTAQAILDARALYPDSSLADLYDELTMPVELRKAHQENDRAVMQAYGFPIKTMTESQCVAELFKLYQKLTHKA